MSKKAVPGTRFRLLIYQRLFKMWFWPSLALAVTSATLIVWHPSYLAKVRWWFAPIALIATGLMIWLCGRQFGPLGAACGYFAVLACVTLPMSTWIWFRCRSEWHSDADLSSA